MFGQLQVGIVYGRQGCFYAHQLLNATELQIMAKILNIVRFFYRVFFLGGGVCN